MTEREGNWVRPQRGRWYESWIKKMNNQVWEGRYEEDKHVWQKWEERQWNQEKIWLNESSKVRENTEEIEFM